MRAFGSNLRSAVSRPFFGSITRSSTFFAMPWCSVGSQGMLFVSSMTTLSGSAFT